MKSVSQILSDYDSKGYAVVERVLSDDFVKRARLEIEAALKKEVEYHGTTEYSDYGMILLCSLYGGVFIEIFENKTLIDGLNAILGEGCILYAYTSSSMPPDKSNYSKRIHVDSPRFVSPDYYTNTGAMILVDEFTEENGATYLLEGSHKSAAVPTEEYFYANAKRLITPPGSICFLNPRLYHAGGVNKTSKWRHAFTMNVCRPWMKQRLDIPRAMSHMDTSRLSETAKQKLGFYAQVPANYDEYYVAPELRKFRQKVE
jgi:ectoine hydroxylase-related dioxygenase (phytanoyl-CoA dioxygenase family)